MATGGTTSAGTQDKAVERIEEGAPASQSGNNQQRGQYDAGLAAGIRREKPVANIDTTQTSGLTPDQDIKRGEPGAW